jgi:DNA polymerase III psi subunit
MLRLPGGQVESLWDEVLPGEVRELPEDLAALDVLLRDARLMQPIAARWRGEAIAHGPPRIPMEVYVRLMIVKQRTGWGYETLVGEVLDSLHLRHFCLIALGERVPHESTVRKLTARADRARQGAHRWPPTTQLQTNPKATRQIPHRSRGQNQSPQAQLRAAPLPPEGKGRSPHLERLGDPGLQP